MRRTMGRTIRIVAVAAAIVAVAVVGVGAGTAGADPVSANATGVGLQLTGACSDNPLMLISGEGVGDGFGEFGALTLADDPPPTVSITVSPLLDDWSFTDSTFGLGADPITDGDLVGGYAVIGDPTLTVAAEWFVLWECGAGEDDATVLFTCFGAYGTCPTSVSEARTLEAEVSPAAAGPGETFTLTIDGCFGGQVAAALLPDGSSEALAEVGPLPSDGEPVVALLPVPSDASPTGAVILVGCSFNADEVVTLPVEVLAATDAPPAAAPAAAPVTASPRFTG